MDLFGRLDITSATETITKENVVSELNATLPLHMKNMAEEDYLYWYRRGKQPILDRTKEVRPEICNKIVENHADEIVSFKNGYFLTEPTFYISRSDDEKIVQNVKRLNDYLYLSGKHNVDNKVVDWFHTVGKGILYVEPDVDNEKIPVRVYALDPRSAYVVRDLTPGNHPLYAVRIVITDEEKGLGIADVFTKNTKFTLKMNAKTMKAERVVDEKANTLGLVPMVEYRYNNINKSAFESVIPLLDLINNIQSNRGDGIEQFIQSLAVGVNCDFEEDVTYNDIRKAGMILLKSIGENRADFKILSEQLNQSETQVFIDYIYHQILTICGMPSTTKGGTSTSDTGSAVLYRDGWYQADTYARNTEDLFRESNRYFDELFITILNKVAGLEIDINDFELQFVRNETANLLVKTQGALNLKQLGLSPEIVLAKSGISNDPVADVANSKAYIEQMWNFTTENMTEKSKTQEMTEKSKTQEIEENQ